MKKMNKIFKISILSTLLAVGFGFALKQNNSNIVKAEAAQYLADFDPYYYTGSYYEDINFSASEGMNGALRISLSSLIKPAGYYSYSGTGPTTISTQLQYADEDPTNHSNMIYLYTRNSVTKNAASSWNREHVWPQSLSNGNWGKSQGGTDILHLRPTYQSTNSSRGNTPYGDINKTSPKYYNGMLYGYCANGNEVFEPLDQVKGDVARTIMYLWTTYNNSSKPLNILSVFESYDTLLRWHTNDKPDVLEGNRNDYCQLESKQKNRNPFVDHPELAWKIFGEKASSSVVSACQNAYPAGGVTPIDPITPTSVNISQTSAKLNVDDTLQLNATLMPNGATGNISWLSSDDSVASVTTSGLVTAEKVGTAVITAKYSNDIKAECTVTVTNSSSGQGGEVEMVSSISIGDIVYLTAHNALQQFDGITSGHGALEAYEEQPSVDGVQLEVGQGTTQNSYTFTIKSTGQYLCWTSGNSLSSQADKNENSSWTVAFDSNKNATIANVADPARVIWYNVSSPRFSCYTGKYAGSGYYATQLWKQNAVAAYDFDTCLAAFDSEMSLDAEEHWTSNTSGNATADLSEQGYENAQEFTGLELGAVTVSADKGTNSNSPKYYSTGTGVRIYGGNNLVFSCERAITKIIFSFDSLNRYGLVSTDNLYDDETATWTGSANEVSFTFSASKGHVRIQTIYVEYGGASTLETVDNVALRFGASVPAAAWDAIASHETINDYGVMLVKENTLINKYACTSIEQAFDNEETLAIVSKGDGEAPCLSNGNYLFKAKVNVANYNTRFCGVPFVVINNEYHFLTELRTSASELATYYKTHDGCDLSSAALNVISGTNN